MASTTAAAAGNRDGTLLVTVGSTLFQALSDAALSPSTLALLPSHGITHLIVQLGKAQMPAHIAGQVSSSTGGTLVLGAQNGGAQTVLGGGEVLKVTVLRYTRDAREMDALLDSARVVVSHAGSGTILSTLRRSPAPRLLVVPNAALMDNHQAELGLALKEGGYLDVCQLDDLRIGLERLLDPSTPAPTGFPPFEPSRFAKLLDATAGFA